MSSSAASVRQKNKTLARFFDMSSSDEEDNEGGVSLPPPRPSAALSSQRSVVPDSQPPEPKTKRLTRAQVQAQKETNSEASNVSLFESSMQMQETQVSVLSSPTASGRGRADEIIPASPEMFEDSEPRRSPRKKNIETPEQSAKRKQSDEVVKDSQQPGTSSKKRKVAENGIGSEGWNTSVAAPKNVTIDKKVCRMSQCKTNTTQVI
jgi:hypothetical protein